MTKGQVDVAGIRLIEGSMQRYAGAVAIGLEESGVRGWSFLLACWEFDGAGTTWVHGPGLRHAAAKAAREWAAALRISNETKRPVATVKSKLTDDERELLHVLASGVMGHVVSEFPENWGGGLLLFGLSSDEPSKIWVSDTSQQGTPEALEEIAEWLHAGNFRPPGVLGREH
jgi:hypothetical protein